MTDTQPRPDHGIPPWGPAGYSSPTGPTPGPSYGGPPPSWTGTYPLPPTVPTPPPPRKRRSAAKVLVIVAAVVFGIPGALVVVGIVAVAMRGTPSPGSPVVAPPAAEASAAPQAAAPSPPPEPDPLDPYDLAEGDCYNSVPLPPDGTTVRIDSVEQVPCSAPHTAQVVGRFAYTDFVWSPETNTRAEADCDRSFGEKVPTKVLADGSYQPALIHPNRAALGLQSVYAACVLVTDTPTTGSVLKG